MVDKSAPHMLALIEQRQEEWEKMKRTVDLARDLVENHDPYISDSSDVYLHCQFCDRREGRGHEPDCRWQKLVDILTAKGEKGC